MAKTMMILITIVIVGCASSEKITGPDGSEHILIACTEIKDCYKEARKACQGNYKIVNSASETNTQVTQVTTTSQNLLIKCSNSPRQKEAPDTFKNES